MIKRVGITEDNEPEQTSFKLPSEGEKLLQVVDIYDNSYEGNKFNLDIDTVLIKLEVVGGEEEGRTLLSRTDINFDGKGFWATRLFLKAIGEPCRGEFELDTDNWIGKQMYATVVHNESKGKTYANIGEYNFAKIVEQVDTVKNTKKGFGFTPLKDVQDQSKEIAWDE